MRAYLWKLSIVPLILAGAQAVPQSSPPMMHMASEAHPAFAVAAIKPHDPDSRREGFSAVGDRFTIRNQSIGTLMMFAYSINKQQVVDAPEFTFDERYDIEGKADTEGEPGLQQQQEMLQKLLVDRFGLRFHHDRRDLSVFAIRIAKGGPKLKPAANPDAQPNQKGDNHGTEQTMRYTSVSMAEFAFGEQFFLDRPVVDQTGLTGRYDFSFRYTYDEAKATDPNAPPGLFTAIQEQLGLKFEATKASTDVFVIDHVERPSEN